MLLPVTNAFCDIFVDVCCEGNNAEVNLLGVVVIVAGVVEDCFVAISTETEATVVSVVGSFVVVTGVSSVRASSKGKNCAGRFEI
jgi:uncharacterized membrane protein HdeD (DUF308 family)